MRWEELDKEPCSLARTLSVVGDRWTLLVLRECFLGVRRFDMFERRLKVTRHILTSRLKKLVEQGVLYKTPYQQSPLREEYRLTDKGLELHPIVMTLVDWGNRHMSDNRGAPIIHIHKPCGHSMQPVTVCSHCGEKVEARNVKVEVGKSWLNQAELLLPKRIE
jgi:DNA-binding HxlR family transcriptional regulator